MNQVNQHAKFGTVSPIPYDLRLVTETSQQASSRGEFSYDQDPEFQEIYQICKLLAQN